MLRNKLVRLMTHLDTDVKRVAAEFLFVLCSESVPRFIKYTGYGNAAGLLAARGLMAGVGLRASTQRMRTQTQTSTRKPRPA